MLLTRRSKTTHATLTLGTLAAILALSAPLAVHAEGPNVLIDPPLASPLIALEWVELTAAQQQSLAPLEQSWSTLNNGQKRKWIAIAHNYHRLGPEEQARMHSRMAEWAALDPKARQLARMNFAETKKVVPSERAAEWEAYQALSQEEKRQLAKKTPKRSAGVAVPAKIIPPGKATNHPDAVPAGLDTVATPVKRAIDPNTLLPLKAAP